MSVPSRCSCVALSAKWAMERVSGGFLSISSSNLQEIKIRLVLKLSDVSYCIQWTSSLYNHVWRYFHVVWRSFWVKWHTCYLMCIMIKPRSDWWFVVCYEQWKWALLLVLCCLLAWHLSLLLHVHCLPTIQWDKRVVKSAWLLQFVSAVDSH